jgi:hypothetical protein
MGIFVIPMAEEKNTALSRIYTMFHGRVAR